MILKTLCVHRIHITKDEWDFLDQRQSREFLQSGVYKEYDGEGLVLPVAEWQSELVYYSNKGLDYLSNLVNVRVLIDKAIKEDCGTLQLSTLGSTYSELPKFDWVKGGILVTVFDIAHSLRMSLGGDPSVYVHPNYKVEEGVHTMQVLIYPPSSLKLEEVPSVFQGYEVTAEYKKWEKTGLSNELD